MIQLFHIYKTRYQCWSLLSLSLKFMQASAKMYLSLLIFVFSHISTQKSCFQAISTRITFGQVYKYYPLYKKTGLAKRQYICTQNFYCFYSSNQFYFYLGEIKNDRTCLCVEGFRTQCIVQAVAPNNIGLKSIFMNGQFYGNEQFKFTKVKMIFLLESRRIGTYQIANQWYLHVAFPIQ